jgi:hypothetical protein
MLSLVNNLDISSYSVGNNFVDQLELLLVMLESKEYFLNTISEILRLVVQILVW